MGYTRRDDLLLQEVDDEIVLYDTERHRAHRLNRTAALVWRGCDGKNTVEDMAALLHREVAVHQDEELVRLTLDGLAQADLLEENVTTPPTTQHPSRRDVLQRLGIATVLLPVVSSISAPTPARAASGRGSSGSNGQKKGHQNSNRGPKNKGRKK